MIIAGDIGGTKARIGLFERRSDNIELVASEQYTSSEFSDLEAIVHSFLEQYRSATTARLEAACFGLPGPVINGRVKVTNLPWEVVQSAVSASLGVHKVKIVNDLISTAAAIPTFGPGSLHTVYTGAGDLDKSGACVVVAPGTGLGHALIHHEGGSNVFLASEGGHANFAPTNEIEIELLRYLQRRLSHVSVESVLCGPGLVNIYSFLVDTGRGVHPTEVKEIDNPSDRAATITQLALQGSSEVCITALDMFCSMLGAHCSNIVLTYLATGGVFLGGGIPPKIVEALAKGPFVEGYLRKGKQRERVAATPVFVVKDDYAALYGAAAIAASL